MRALNADELSPRIWEKGNGSEENRIVEVGLVELRASLQVCKTPWVDMPDVGRWECGLEVLFCRLGWLCGLTSHQPR